MEVLIQNFSYITWQMLVMWGIGGLLIYLAMAKEMEPTLLLPMGFGQSLSTCLLILLQSRRQSISVNTCPVFRVFWEHFLRSVLKGLSCSL